MFIAQESNISVVKGLPKKSEKLNRAYKNNTQIPFSHQPTTKGLHPFVMELSRLGFDAYKAGRYSNAFNYFKAVLENSAKGNAPASLFYQLGSAEMQLGNIPEAISSLKEAVSLASKSGTIKETEKYKNKLEVCQALGMVGVKRKSPKI